MNPDLPPVVKIGAYDIIIESWDGRSARGSARFGEFSPCEGKIRVDESAFPRLQGETLLHEIMHATWWVWGIGGNADEERAVNGLSQGLAAVWRDNPDVMAWIFERLSR